MTLEFEKLTDEVEAMVRSTYLNRRERQQVVENALEKLREQATAWEKIERCVTLAREVAGIKELRAARPLDHDEPLDAAVDPPAAPAQATLLAADGSQILPDRHGAFLYSLINVGVIVYFHGRGLTPQQFTVPTLDYPGRDGTDDEVFAESGTVVSLRRDRAEIETLARSAWEYRDEPTPRVVVLDQRLLYWPAVGASDTEGSRVLQGWQEAMTAVRGSDGWLVGYIANPGKRSILTLLNALDIEESGFDDAILVGRGTMPGLTDARLFSYFLAPGQRSKVFVDVSQHNDDFRGRDPHNEVCFFYLNPGRSGQQIARVDLPMWVAQDPDKVAAVHALLYDQCQIIGDYPYILARADELAVVGRRDQENLDSYIAAAMQRHGLTGDVTAKQSSKDIARAGRTRHEI